MKISWYVLLQYEELFGLSGIRYCSLDLSAVYHAPCGLSRSVTVRAFRSRRGSWWSPYSERETSHNSFIRQIIYICYYLLLCVNKIIYIYIYISLYTKLKETIKHGHDRHNTTILSVIHNKTTTCFGGYYFWPSSGWIRLSDKTTQYIIWYSITISVGV